MLQLLLSMPAPLAGGIVVAVAVGLTLAGLAGVRRRFPVEDLRAGNDVAGLLYGTLAGVYAVLLAFVLVAVWEEFRRAEERVEGEVTSLDTLFWDAAMLPEPHRTQVHDALLDYVRSVVEDEWPEMAEGNGSSRTLTAYGQLFSAFAVVENDERSTYYDQALERLAEVGQRRRGRILASRSNVPTTMWVLLLSGAVVVTGLALMLGSEHPGTHRIAVAALASIVSSVLFVTVALDRPFGAGITLSPRPFTELAEQWQR